MLDPTTLQAIAQRIAAGAILSQEEQRFLLVAHQSGQLPLGERAISVGGNAGNAVFVTGDQNSLQINNIEAIQQALRTVLQEWHPAPQLPIESSRRQISPTTLLAPELNLQATSFAFEIVTLGPKQEIQRKQAYAKQWVEDLGKGIHLEMVHIPGGSFLMGPSETEPGYSSTEFPQHLVSISEFWMGKYPITQAQWKAVSDLLQVNRSIKSKPSKFKGNDLPVEGISWYEAVEFCDRLAQHSGLPYRLPSEAEWEYACRAGTQTSFHFGNALCSELANYSDDTPHHLGRKAKSQGHTTPIRHYQAANAFGLHDLHGNVWEWCLDCWHDDYTDAPSDGSARIDSGENHPRVHRGGSWFDPPSACRCASRTYTDPDLGSSTLGFRVVLSMGGETSLGL